MIQCWYRVKAVPLNYKKMTRSEHCIYTQMLIWLTYIYNGCRPFCKITWNYYLLSVCFYLGRTLLQPNSVGLTCYLISLANFTLNMLTKMGMLKLLFFFSFKDLMVKEWMKNKCTRLAFCTLTSQGDSHYLPQLNHLFKAWSICLLPMNVSHYNTQLTPKLYMLNTV